LSKYSFFSHKIGKIDTHLHDFTLNNEYFHTKDNGIAVYFNIMKSWIYGIACCSMMFPENDVPRWVFTHRDVDTTIVVNEFRVWIDAPSLSDIHIRYSLSKSNASLNKPFLHKFKEDHPDFNELMEDWWGEEIEFYKKNNRLVLVQYLKRPYRLLVAMICRLYGEETSTHI